jgi:hypothetical protein
MTESDSYGQSLEVTWPLGPTTVYGTVVMPEGAGPFPGVVLVAGSGPTDRDWDTHSFLGPIAAVACSRRRWGELGSPRSGMTSAPQAPMSARRYRS